MSDTSQPFDLQTTEVLGRTMAYVDEGEGDPILLLHGNPTSSYLWRDVIPPLVEHGRCIAPDLIGMGGSDKLPGTGDERYRFIEHRRYLDALLEQLDVTERVTLVVHDWGSGLGFDWANRHRDAVRGIAYMEAIVQPVTWADWPEAARDIFRAMRSEAGEAIVLDKNVFVERILPSSIIRDLSDEEMAVHRAPFAVPGEDRRPTLTWPRELPIEGEPTDVHRIVTDYGRWLAGSDLPKLFVNADPGSILIGDQREFCRTWPNQTEVTVPGIHFIQEDSGERIGRAVAEWLDGL
ncbi:MAG: haloalkane dehalogenase, partial [Nitriliruptor sp.]